MSNDTKQHASVNADVLKRLHDMDAFSEMHDEHWKNELARDLNDMVQHAIVEVSTSMEPMAGQIAASILRIVERVAQFEGIKKAEFKPL